MLATLPPAGNRISLRPRRDSGKSIEELVRPYNVRLYQSGTAALAATLVAAVARRPQPQPEVLLPAYACPDLISAILYAGARPVLVDLSADTPWLDLSELAARITERSVAVIAVNFLGIPERLNSLRAIADKAGILLIEDNAQSLFDPIHHEGPRGDFIIQSFGRGKPVSLLQGGAVLYRDPPGANCLPDPDNDSALSMPDRVSAVLKVLLYNVLLTPLAYGLVDALPFLHIGETRYKPLRGIESAGSLVGALLPANVDAYRARPETAQYRLRSMLAGAGLSCVVDLASASNASTMPRLLRYPVLMADSARRDMAYRRMQKAGLGVSRMYPSALPGIAGLGGILDPGARYPGAERFARSILTLPTHSGVGERHIKAMESILLQSCTG